jgi:hypothetical protein
MRRILAAVVTALALLTPVVAAHADEDSFRGGCGFVAVNDTTPGSVLGGEDVWDGLVYMLVTATDENGLPASFTAWCTLRINGGYETTVLGPKSGTGIVVDAGTLQFTAEKDSRVEMCTHVRFDNGSEIVKCKDVTVTQVIPQPVIDLIDQVLSIVEDVVCPVVESPCNLLAQLLDLLAVTNVYVMEVRPDFT